MPQATVSRACLQNEAPLLLLRWLGFCIGENTLLTNANVITDQNSRHLNSGILEPNPELCCASGTSVLLVLGIANVL